MYTGTEIFNMSISVIDELSDTGGVSDSQVKEYKNRAPYLLDMWQKEAAKSGDLYNIVEFENTSEDNVYKWTKFTLPANTKSIKDIIFLDSDSQMPTIEYKRFGNSDIYFYFTKTGTVRVLFIPVPAKITALTQNLEVDDFIAISGAYYLAIHFALADQNTDLADRCKVKFNEIKKDSLAKDPIGNTEIIDVYG